MIIVASREPWRLPLAALISRSTSCSVRCSRLRSAAFGLRSGVVRVVVGGKFENVFEFPYVCALRHIPANDRHIWLDIGMALNAELGDAGRPLWDDWSASCADKFSDRDQDKTWRSFGRRDGITIATLFHYAQQASWRGNEWPQLYSGSKQEKPNSATKQKTSLDALFNAGRLNRMTFDPIKFVVHGYIVEGLTLFAGKPKVGKSWLLLHAAFAVAEGSFTLGGAQCEQGDVLYCALEDNPRRLQSRLTKLFGTQDWPARLNFTCEMPRLAEGGLDFIKNWIEGAERPRLVIIDTLAMVRMPNNKDKSTYDADYAAVKELRDLALKYGIAIILVHHLRKAEADDPFDTVSGTLGLTGAVDTVMILRRDTRGTILHAKGRDLVEIEKAISFDAGTCSWTIVGDADATRKSAERTTIVAALEEAGTEPLSPNQIAGAVGMKPVNVKKMLARLVADSVIKKASYGKYVLATVAAAAARAAE
jgi:AAA domain/Primase C terminal 2 (PriCT-2)